MTDTTSTRTKTISDTADSESTEGPLLFDRWTNNISYRQLVLSSCIGIFQMWWHPYVHDFRRLLPFLFLYQIFSIIVAYPLFYLELALGVVTKKGVINCWDLAPMARGFAMLAVCLFSALVASAAGAWFLALLVHSFHVFLPWLHCAAAAKPPCAARHRPLPPGSETPSQSFFFNYVLDLKRDALFSGLGKVTWELTTYYIICWFLIYFIVIKRIYSYSKLVLFKDVLAFFVLVCCAVGVSQLQGSGRMFKECDWSVMFEGAQMWREAMEYSLIELTVSQGSLVMLGSYCPKSQHKLGTTAMLSFVVAKSSCMITALILGATHGALSKDYDAPTNIRPGASSAVILWADLVARIPGSQFWSALIFFTLFLLSLTTAGGLYLMEFLMIWPASKPRALIAAMVTTIITYIYGQTTFCEEVYFAVGEYPSVFMRVSWALSPAVMMSLFAGSSGSWASSEVVAGWLVVVFQVFPIVIVLVFYAIFKCRVRNIVQEK
ncbi:unnamed protein product [Arctia plantaginis]|uniref:Uncharacterized protein n=1 Tax=Arctia plantaginis TaxID=874455 RepID=A0A8S0YQA3_ARCPL|nr:unnamed protein product [Arctia plantaginis]